MKNSINEVRKNVRFSPLDLHFFSSNEIGSIFKSFFRWFSLLLIEQWSFASAFNFTQCLQSIGRVSSSLSLIAQSIKIVFGLFFSEDFSLEHSVAELVEGLESNRSNAQLWCLYLEFSSWNMSNEELHHLCSAALKNAQSYDLFWTVEQRFDRLSFRFSSFVRARSSIFVRIISKSISHSTTPFFNRIPSIDRLLNVN